MLAYIDSGFYNAGLTFDESSRKITKAAPIVKWTIGKDIDYVRKWSEKKGYKFEFILEGKMIYQHLVKRIIYEAKCSCGDFKVDVDRDPPRERQCSCGKEWCKFEEVSATGPDLLTESK